MVETGGSTTSDSHYDKQPIACFEDESLTRNVKKEVLSSPQHSLVRSVTPDEEIPLDYVESEESPTSDASPHKKPKQEDNSIDAEEMLLKDAILTSSPSPEHNANNITNGHGEKDAKSRTPDDEEVLGDNLELRSLNDEIGHSDDNAPSYVDGAVAISDDDENETTSERQPNKRRRPRTPLSPCPENVSNDELDIPDASEDISERRSKRNDKVLSRVVRVNRLGDGDGPSGEVPEAYRRPRRRPRGGRRVRAAAMRQAALRRDVDSRLLENRRIRLERLREAQNRRTGSDRHVPRRDLPESSRRIRETLYNEASRPMPALNWVPPVAEVSRRNPSYYPPRRSRSPSFRVRSPLPSSSRGRSPFLSPRLRATPPVRRPLLPISSSSRRNRSPTSSPSSRNQPPPRRSTFDHRSSPPHRNHRSRSPQQRIPHRPVPTSRPLWASSSRNGDRRHDSHSSYSSSRPRRCSPPLISRYPGPRDSRHRVLSPPPSRHSRELPRPALPLPPVKRWRCPPREPSP